MSDSLFMTPEQLLRHWQGHRALTRRVIEAFPEDKLFSFSIGGMRTFGEMCNEFIAMTVPMVAGLASGEWQEFTEGGASNRHEVLERWDSDTAELERIWPTIADKVFQETITAFGMYTDLGESLVLYCVDNEIHHRGQGYVYLRALGVEPPPFYGRP